MQRLRCRVLLHVHGLVALAFAIPVPPGDLDFILDRIGERGRLCGRGLHGDRWSDRLGLDCRDHGAIAVRTHLDREGDLFLDRRGRVRGSVCLWDRIRFRERDTLTLSDPSPGVI